MAKYARKALLAGATGLTGGHLLSFLLSDPRYASVTAMVREACLQAKPNLGELVVDFRALPALPRADDAYCCLGTTIKKAGSQAAFREVDFEFVISFARAAKQAGAKRFLVISAMGASPRSSVFYSRVKGQMESALREIGFDALFVFQPSLILGQRKELRPAERLGIAAADAVRELMIGPMRKYRPIEAATIAQAMIKAAFSRERGVHVYQSDAIEAMV